MNDQRPRGFALTADVELDSDAVGGVAAGAAPVTLAPLARGPSLRRSGRRCRLRAVLRVVVGRLHPAEAGDGGRALAEGGVLGGERDARERLAGGRRDVQRRQVHGELLRKNSAARQPALGLGPQGRGWAHGVAVAGDEVVRRRLDRHGALRQHTEAERRVLRLRKPNRARERGGDASVGEGAGTHGEHGLEEVPRDGGVVDLGRRAVGVAERVPGQRAVRVAHQLPVAANGAPRSSSAEGSAKTGGAAHMYCGRKL